MASPEPLSPLLAQVEPEAFGVLVLEHMANESRYGAEIWNAVAERDTGYTNEIHVDTSTWASSNRGRNGILLGTKPMSGADKSRIFFDDSKFTYSDEVAYRLLHEVNHSYLYKIQASEGGQSLLLAAGSAREATEGRLGLSALGSLDYYKTFGVRTQLIEDSVELMTMYAWDPDYACQFARFLANPAMQGARAEVGLVSLDEPNTLIDIVSSAVVDNL